MYKFKKRYSCIQFIDKRSITSILTVKKTPPYFGVLFYYYCNFDPDSPKNFAVFVIPGLYSSFIVYLVDLQCRLRNYFSY